MKLLYVINALTIGGAQILLIDLVKSALKAGHNVEVAAFRDGALSEKLISLGISPRILGEKFFDLIPLYRLIRLIKTYKPSVIHSHLFRATALTRIAKLLASYDGKLITTIHGLETEAYHLLERLMYSQSDYFIFPSHYLSDWYALNIGKLDKANHRVIYPGVNIDLPVVPNSGKIRVIGSLSRLHRIKGLDVLVKAGSILKEHYKSFEIRIGGGGKGKEALEKLVSDCNVGDVCKFVDDVSLKSDYLEGLDIFVSPSRQEGFGINLCEAMERSLPVVATRVGGIPEVVKDGETGFLCDADNPCELAKKLEIFMNDAELCKKMGHNGRKRVECLFDRQQTMEEHMELYSEISDKKRVHFAVSSRELGGGERLALDLILNLKARGWTVTATCAGNPLYETLLANNIDCSVVSMDMGGVFFGIKLLNDLKKYKPSVVSSHLNKASLFAGLLGKITGIPTVSHVHGLNKKIYYMFSKRQIAVSGAVKRHLEEQGLTGESLVAINNCINKPAVGVREFPNRPLNISITAKLHRNKGHEWALKVINSEISKLKVGKIHIFGDGPERAKLETLCNSLPGIKDKVVFYGFVNNVENYYSGIDLALLPSLGEGIPLSLLEVMRLGIPCIATNVGGIPEIVENGESGLLVEPENGADLISAINKVSEKNYYEKLSIGAFNRFKKVNNHEKMIDDFEKLLLENIA